MIDIHNHMLYGVDDGPSEIEESMQMLEQAKKQGITAMILTPHYRHGMFAYPIEDITDHFRKLQAKANELGVTIYLGCEYHVNSQIVENLDNRRVATLARTKYVLAEYSFETEFDYIYKTCQELLSHGYYPVIAHAERYACLAKDTDNVDDLKRLGALIQVNADSILGIDGHGLKKTCKKFLKEGLVDLVASDSHGIKQRINHMSEAMAYVTKKYGSDYAQEIFEKNQQGIISSRA